MLIEWEDKTYDYDPQMIDMGQAIGIKKHTGLGMLSWERGVDDADPICLQALLWVVKRQAGERVPIGTLDFSVVGFYTAVKEAAMKQLQEQIAQSVEEAQAEHDAADPTVTPEPA